MTIYKAQEMYKLAYSKQPLEKEKQMVMDKIYEAASKGQFQISFFKHDFINYRLIIAWLVDYGYCCRSFGDLDTSFIVKWEIRV